MAHSDLASLSHTIHHIVNHDSYSISPHEKQQMISIHEYTIFLQIFFENFPEKDNSLEGRIRDLANKAEDMIEHFMSEQIRLRYGMIKSSIARPSRFKFIDYLSGKYTTHLQELKRVAEQIESIAGEVTNIMYRFRIDQDARLSDSFAPSSSSRLAPSQSLHKKDVVVGFDDDLFAIQERLCGESPKLQIIPIAGMGGIGKTTLARNAYHDPLIIESFHIRAWVTVSQDYSSQKVLSDLLSSVKESSTERCWQRNELDLYQSLKGRRYLIVMDDMWSTQAWDDIKMIFPDDNNGSRVMITTRLSDVAAYAADSSNHLHQMHLMGMDHSWDLLQREVFAHEHCPPELEKIGKEIARSCGGLPLAITVIAGLLSTLSMTPASWGKIAENIKSIIASSNGQLEEILSMSYSHLPHHLRPCFLYMGAFPEDYEIRVSKLVKLWIAEGFIATAVDRSFEEVAEEYVEDLVRRSLVLVSKRNSDGKIKSCSVHDLMRELCIRKARQEKFLVHVTNGRVRKKSIKNQRRLCINLYYPNRFEDFHDSNTRTIICFLLDRASPDYLGHFRLLRVLDLVYAKYPGFGYSLPVQVFELFHLRYLAFPCPVSGFHRRVRIPSSISKLESLQTLIIRDPRKRPCHSSNLISLPREIWRMPQLRHLVCFYFGMLPDPEEGATCGVLQNLQTLQGITDLVCTDRILKMIPNIKKMEISYFPNEFKQEFCFENLQQLVELKLTGSRSFTGMNASPTFPRMLKKLSLSSWPIPWKCMRTVGLLPNLQVLKLRNHSIFGTNWETREGEFLRLEFLLIENTHLKHWITETSHFPRLKRLFLHGCPHIGEIPDGIGEIMTLELIDIKNGPTSLALSAKRIQEEQRSYGNDAFEVRVSYSYPW